MNKIHCYLLLIFLLFGSYHSLKACSTSEHHSVSNHYNHAKKVFEAKVLKVGKLQQRNFSFEYKETGIRSIFIKVEVTRNHKNTLVKEQLTIGVLPGLYRDFEVGASYLIYANAKKGYDFLICENGFSTTDKEAMRLHAFLWTIPVQHTGYLIEYDTSGNKWAEGNLENGLPVGAWNYYSKSGELQIKGSYQNGEEVGLWQYYYHTDDDTYAILSQIISGDYYKKTGSYELLQLDSNSIGVYKHQLVYTVGEDTLRESFYYNISVLSKQVSYQNGWRNGIEERFNEEGICISVYQFEEDLLEGAYWETQAIRGVKNGHLKVEGYYKKDKKYDERHLYYENKVLSKTKEILKAGKLL
jgi:antitoxin component YwqK of YwqJK toxin-antitoxin module